MRWLAAGFGQGPAHAFGFDGVLGVAQARGIGDMDQIAAQIQPHLDHIPGGAGDFGDNGDVAPGQGIDQRAFAGIGRADDGQPQAFAQRLAAPLIVNMCLNFLGYFRTPRRGRRSNSRLAHPVIGKIDRRFGPGQGRDQAGPPAFIELGQRAFILAQRLAQLGRGFGIDQIGDGFGPGEIEPAIFHRPAAEFARLGGAQAQIRQAPRTGLRAPPGRHGYGIRPHPRR